jgi:transposase
MVPAKRRNSQPTLAEVQALFEEWRENRKGRDPIPPALWAKAVALSKIHSINAISRDLRLSYNELKSRASAQEPQHAFIEIGAVTTIECTIEMEKPGSRKMQVYQGRLSGRRRPREELLGMIQVTPQMRILLAMEPVDFRKGIDGLAGTMKGFAMDPFSGVLFIFRNRRGTSLKVLMYDGQGFWLCQKRLSKGRFRLWSKEREPHPYGRP